MTETILVGALCFAIALVGMSTFGALGLPEIGATALLAGLAGGACMMAGQN